MLLTAFWSTLFEPIVHDLPLEKALRHCEYVAKLFNWQAIFAFSLIAKSQKNPHWLATANEEGENNEKVTLQN